MFNNSYRVFILASQLDDPLSDAAKPTVRRTLSSDPILLSRLPSSKFIEREAKGSGPKEVLRQLRRSASPPSPTPSESESHPTSERRTSSPDTAMSDGDRRRSLVSQADHASRWKEPEPFEVFRAVERKDIMFLSEVRDRAFHLLLRKTGDATPLVHAMRIGESHRDVTIILLGAMSRWVNHLDDRDMADRRTRPLLKALRTNLKLAIDYGLQRSQSDLIASFMQTLIMSEGERWVATQAYNVAVALKSGTEGKPMQTAETAVRKFATRELGKADLIAALEDYVSNATIDLVIMGAWTWVLDSVQGEQIPTYYFARDDRVFKAFRERLHRHRGDLERLSKRLKWQIRVLEHAVESRTTSYRSKAELLTSALDEGRGV